MRIRNTVTIILLALSLVGYSQSVINSPYSRYGIGDLSKNGYSRGYGMGNIGVANSNPYFSNLINPALLADSKYTIFEFGLLGKIHGISDGSLSQTNGASNLDYLGITFSGNNGVQKNHWSAAIGMRPYSELNYHVSVYDSLSDSSQANLNYSGSGGINQFYITNGFRFGKSLYIGLETSFLVGNISRESSSQLAWGDSLDNTINIFSDKQTVQGFKFKPGFAYKKEISTFNRYGFKSYKVRNKAYKSYDRKVEEYVISMSNEDIKKDHPELFTDESGLSDKEKAKRNNKIKKLKTKYAKSVVTEDTLWIVKNDSSARISTLFVTEKHYVPLESAKVGQYVVLLPERKYFYIDQAIDKLDEKNRLVNIIGKNVSENMGVIILPSAKGQKTETIVHELDSLSKVTEQSTITKDVKSAYRNYIREKSGMFLTFGLTYDFSAKLSTKNLTTTRRENQTGYIYSIDTTAENDGGNLVIPQGLNIGIGLEKPFQKGTKRNGEKKTSIWSIGMDISVYQWSKYSNDYDNTQYTNSFRFAMGGEILPNAQATKNRFFNRTMFRAGFSYEKTQLVVNGYQVNDFGINFGVSLPVYSASNRYAKPKYLNIGMTIGQRGSKNNGLIQEQYFMTSVGININDVWFKRTKIGVD